MMWYDILGLDFNKYVSEDGKIAAPLQVAVTIKDQSGTKDETILLHDADLRALMNIIRKHVDATRNK